jgi:hypothetical protein
VAGRVVVNAARPALLTHEREEPSMALAYDTDVEARLGRDLTAAEDEQVDTLLDEASDLVIGYCHTDFEPGNPYPEPVTRVVAGMVARTLLASAVDDPFTEQQANGPFSRTRSAAATTGDVWLTGADKIKLRPYRVGGGLSSAQLVGERYTIDES